MDESMSGFGGGIGLLVLILIFLFGFGGNGVVGGGSATEVYSKLASESAGANSREILSQGYENQLATQRASYENLLQFKDVQAQLASCCCDIKSTVIEQNQMTRDLINANTITELRAELVEARDEIVTAAQTQALLNVLAPRPVPTTAIYGYPVF
jgi:hypothetical protein